MMIRGPHYGDGKGDSGGVLWHILNRGMLRAIAAKVPPLLAVAMWSMLALIQAAHGESPSSVWQAAHSSSLAHTRCSLPPPLL